MAGSTLRAPILPLLVRLLLATTLPRPRPRRLIGYKKYYYESHEQGYNEKCIDFTQSRSLRFGCPGSDTGSLHWSECRSDILFRSLGSALGGH
ncbi:hypothetical protein BJ742DRAFT_796565 [Cladochytrium replicatum]|nr:hypothetical protein BJ742DRAFT_796565 [Cladochytrium replicatum]